MIKTLSYYKYLINLKIKYLSKQYIYCFFLNIIHLNMNIRNILFQQLIIKNYKFLIIKNLKSTQGLIIPSSGEHLLIYINNILDLNILEEFNLSCLNIAFRGYFINNIFNNKLFYWQKYIINNFMILISYLIYIAYIYANILLFLRIRVAVNIHQLKIIW